MLRRLLQSLSVLLVILVTSSASAGTINVLGFVDFGPGEVPIGSISQSNCPLTLPQRIVL